MNDEPKGLLTVISGFIRSASRLIILVLAKIVPLNADFMFDAILIVRFAPVPLVGFVVGWPFASDLIIYNAPGGFLI